MTLASFAACLALVTTSVVLADVVNYSTPAVAAAAVVADAAVRRRIQADSVQGFNVVLCPTAQNGVRVCSPTGPGWCVARGRSGTS